MSLNLLPGVTWLLKRPNFLILVQLNPARQRHPSIFKLLPPQSTTFSPHQSTKAVLRIARQHGVFFQVRHPPMAEQRSSSEAREGDNQLHDPRTPKIPPLRPERNQEHRAPSILLYLASFCKSIIICGKLKLKLQPRTSTCSDNPSNTHHKI